MVRETKASWNKPPRSRGPASLSTYSGRQKAKCFRMKSYVEGQGEVSKAVVTSGQNVWVFPGENEEQVFGPLLGNPVSPAVSEMWFCVSPGTPDTRPLSRLALTVSLTLSTCPPLKCLAVCTPWFSVLEKLDEHPWLCLCGFVCFLWLSYSSMDFPVKECLVFTDFDAILLYVLCLVYRSGPKAETGACQRNYWRRKSYLERFQGSEHTSGEMH